jgi:hypothetical protein
MTTITGDIFAPQPPQPTTVAPPAAQPRAPITPTTDRENARNDRRQADKGERGVSFRSILSAETFDGLATAVSATFEKAEQEHAQREERVPKAEPVVISSTESAQLYQAAQLADWNAPAAKEFRAAASQYAKSFFSIEGTFARPGEALELSA